MASKSVDRMSASQSTSNRLGGLVERYFEFALSLPSLVYIILIVGFPMIYLFYLAMTEGSNQIGSATKFVGMKNMIEVLSSPEYWQFFVNTVGYAFVSVILGVVLAIIISLALNVDLPYKRVWQTLIILPWAVPFVVSTLMWRFMFNPNFGLINWMLITAGIIDQPVLWFQNTWAAWATIVMTNVWIDTPMAVLILLAGLSNIPDEMYEVARIEGAGPWQRFRYVTLPLLRPAIIVVVMIKSLLALRGFDIIFAMTEGGPGYSTMVIGIDVFQKLIVFGDVGYAAAEAIILTVFILGVLVVLWKFTSVDYEVA